MTVEGIARSKELRARYQVRERRRAWMRLARRALLAYWVICIVVIAYGLWRLL